MSANMTQDARDFLELLLGFYEADARRITCFSKGISYVAATLTMRYVHISKSA